ncbi:MAG TPA: hypothetical protein DHW61_02855 [Lachnoclostridium phytofermentans]|uniref:Urocanate reductase n=1 Tax=Lachnoclostridium phytofermentans TaxID=66219 RepID=A0A3D2X2Z5_9FIRM|nr:FAD-dependent oxidoreductase [Lachnoclostridium sp.]HCL01346.1 hypothetical protein [Lachnoclostridium phytofermentans]
MKKIKKILAIIMCTCLLFSMVGCSKTENNVGLGYTAGTYTGVSKNGKNGPVKVEIKFSKDKIDSVKVTEHKETKGLTDSAIERIPSEVVENQSLNIDAISGATITCDAILEAVADCVKQANGDVEALKAKKVDKNVSNEVVEKRADVVIIGGGATGMSAAISSAQSGAESVIVLEKASSIGGNAIVSGGYFEYISAPDELRPENTEGYTQVIENILAIEPVDEVHADMQKELKKQYDEYLASGSTKVFDSTYLAALDYLQLESYSTPESMFGFATLLDDTANWLTEMGMTWKPLTGIVGYTWPRWSSPLEGYEGHGYFDLFNKTIEKNNYPVEIMTETPGKELIVEDGKVVGVVAKDSKGTEYRIRANKGVVIATGGFSANMEMVKKYNTMWESIEDVTATTNVGTMTGDGIVMAEKVGAQLALMDDIMLFPMADPFTSTTENIVGDDGDALFVNKEGKRFVNETLDRYTLSAAVLEQPDKMHYLISDNTNSLIKDGHTFNGYDVEEMIEGKQLFRADTLEDLAKQIGIDPEVFVATITKYNESAKNFKDEEFGRISFSKNSTIDEAPYYALPRVVARHITGGGLVRDDQYRVLNEKNEPIEGLYAGGEVTAGMSGISSFGDGMYIGKILFEK